MNFPLRVSPSKEMGDLGGGRVGSIPAKVGDFSLPPVVSHFLTRTNAQWEIYGFTLALSCTAESIL